MKVAIVCAGCTPGEADQLLKSMATFEFTGGVSAFRNKLIAVAQRLLDLSAELATVGTRDGAVPAGRRDQFRNSGGVDPRDLPPRGLRARNIYIPDLHLDTIKCRLGISAERAGQGKPAEEFR